MISREECQVRARDHRIEAFRILSSRDRLIAARKAIYGLGRYPQWVRVHDQAAGNEFARARAFQRLADGPAWKRWIS